MLICVDGTDTYEGTLGDLLFGTKNRTANYAQDMMGSFVWMLYYGSRLQNRKYYQGPDLLGTGPNMIQPFDLLTDISKLWRQGDHQIFMAGYSRGAGIVINTAALMTAIPMFGGQYAQIEAMFLFDAVARSKDLPLTQYIPNNVKFCYHAMRDDKTRSRWTFGHCGVAANLGTRLGVTYFVPRKFNTTHGGMGGVLWGEKGLPNLTKDIQAQMSHQRTADERAARAGVLKTSCIQETLPDGAAGPTNVTGAQEKQGSQEVHNWMWPFLRKHHVL